MRALLGRLLTSRFNARPAFIVGAGRSGTTALNAALRRHPEIVSLGGEAPLLPYVGSLLGPIAFGPTKDYHADYLGLSTPYLYESLRRLCFECVAGPHFGLSPGSNLSKSAGLGVFSYRRWCAKTFPTREQCAGLLELYPAARFVYIVRNGCDVVASRTRFRGFRHMSFEEQCEVWAVHVEKYRYLADVPEAMRIRQEDLVSRPVEVLASVIQFLGLTPHDGPGDYAKSNLVNPHAEATEGQKDVGAAFAARKPGWTEWGPEQRQTFERICGKQMEELGYAIPF